ncbi:hypothetical protein ACE6H2_018166 [Prunus campanulata]
MSTLAEYLTPYLNLADAPIQRKSKIKNNPQEFDYVKRLETREEETTATSETEKAIDNSQSGQANKEQQQLSCENYESIEGESTANMEHPKQQDETTVDENSLMWERNQGGKSATCSMKIPEAP